MTDVIRGSSYGAQQIGNQVNNDHTPRCKNDQPAEKRKITPEDCFVEQPANSRPTEDRFGYNGACEKSAKFETDHRDRSNNRVWEGVQPEHTATARPLANATRT